MEYKNKSRITANCNCSNSVHPAEKIHNFVRMFRSFDINEQTKSAKEAISLGQDSISDLLKLLKDNNLTVRWKAAYALGEIGDKRGVAPLIEALDNEERMVLPWIVQSLGKLGDPVAAGPICNKLNSFYANHEKIESERAMMSQKDSELDRSIEEAIIILGIETLGLLKDARTVPFIISILIDPRKEIRVSAIWILNKMNDERAIPVLEGLLKSETDDQIKFMANTALANIIKRYHTS